MKTHPSSQTSSNAHAMKKTLFSAIGLAMLLAMAASGCDRCDDPTNPECRNYDPCLVQGAVSAEFDMFEVVHSGSVRNWEVEVTTGKLAHRRPLRLVGLDSGEVSHEWIIGLEPSARRGQTQVISFWDWRGTVKITHIVTGTPRTACFPNDDGIDTVVKTIQVLDYDENLPIIGTFRGYLKIEPAKLFDMEVLFNPDRNWIEVINLPDGCTGALGVLSGANGVLILSSNVYYDECWGISQGLGQLSANRDTLTIPFNYKDPDSLALTPQKFIERSTTFIGIRQ